MSLTTRFAQDIAWEYSLIDRMRVRGHIMSMQTVCMLRMFFQQCRGVNWIEPRHLQQVTQDFIQHVDAFAQKHKIPLITAKPGESHVDQAAQYLDTVADRPEGVYCIKALREHALIESAVSSNRIEGVEVDQKRVGTIVFGKALLRDRDEEEVRGYRKALDLIHTKGAALPVTEATIRQLHSLSRAGVGDAGEYKQSENDIIEVHPDDRRDVRFRTVRSADTPPFMAELIQRWQDVQTQRTVHPLIALGFQFGLSLHPSVPRR